MVSGSRPVPFAVLVKLRLSLISICKKGLSARDGFKKRRPNGMQRRDDHRAVDRTTGPGPIPATTRQPGGPPAMDTLAPPILDTIDQILEHAYASASRAFLRSSFTTRGFARPAVFFITWPTNQPMAAFLPPR